MEVVKRTVDGIRNPEYTGENRCLPCTVLNVLIAILVAGSIALLSPLAGGVVLLFCLIAIALRGYLIPGTPTLTARYLPDPVLRRFDKADLEAANEASATGGDAGGTVDSDVESLLRSAGVVEADPEADDLRLTEDFREVWWRRIRHFREDGGTDQLATILDVDPQSLSIDSSGEDGRVTVFFEDDAIGHWVSEAAFYADIAVEPTLREWLPEWDELDDDRRTSLIAGLRAFLEACPRCEADLEPVENVRKSCCSSDFVRVNVDCDACGSRVFTGSYR